MSYDLLGLEQLWIQAGGDPKAAGTAAAIALAESSGNPQDLNNDPATGDYSVGLWQINYYGNLYAGRAAQFGPPAGLHNPLANARAAVAISNNGADFSPWSTYKDGAYQQYLTGGFTTPPAPLPGTLIAGDVPKGQGPAIRTRPSSSGSVAGFLGGAGSGLEGAVTSVWKAGVDAVEGPMKIVLAALWLLKPQNWLRAVEFATGMFLIVSGLVGLAVALLARSDVGREAAAGAALAPGPVGAVGKAVSLVGSSSGRRHAARRAGERAPGMKARRRGAEQAGEREQRRSDERAELARARGRGRSRVNQRKREAAFRVEHPDYDVIPF